MRRISIAKMQTAFRLRFASGLSQRRISQALGVGRATIGEYFSRFDRLGCTWEQVQKLTPLQFEQLLFASANANKISQIIVDWSSIHRELSEPGTTLKRIWQ